jgi:DNA-binding transcriptional LysR family regulator
MCPQTMGRGPMDSVALTVFVQVAETRSFVVAGRTLGISASGIGKSVGRLEQSLGVRLFHRSTRSVTLTAEGEMLLGRARRILTEFDAAQTELSQLSAVPKGRLRIGLPMIGEPFLPALAEFQRRYSEVELDLEFDNRKVDVIEEGYDAVIRTGDIEDSRLTTRLLENPCTRGSFPRTPAFSSECQTRANCRAGSCAVKSTNPISNYRPR